MRILVDVRLLSRGNSGIQEYTRHLVSELLRQAPEHTFVLWFNSFRARILPRELEEAPNVEIRTLHIPNILLALSQRFFRFPNIARLYRADVALSPHFDLLETGSVPRIIVFHDLSFLHYPSFFSLRQRLWHTLQGYRSQARRAAYITTHASFTREDIIRLLGISPERVSVIHPGIPSRSSGGSPPEQDSRERARDQKPYFLYLGTLEPRKNILAIIDAFSAFKRDQRFGSFKLCLAGLSGWLYSDIFTRAGQSGASGDILFLGPVSAEEKYSLYRGATALLYPSFFEGFGFPPLEAQAAGTPVIASSRSSFPETLRDSALIVDPWRTHELTDALRSLATSSVLRRTFRDRGAENALRFSWQSAAQSFLTLLHHAAKSS